MKKILAIVLAAMMLLSVAACGTTPDETTKAPETTEAPETNGGNEQPAGPAVIAPSVDKETLGYLFYEKMVEVKTANPNATSGEIVEAIMNSNLSIAVPGAMAMPMEPDGFLQGIGKDGATFGGFKSATVLAPMMMGVPFMLYVFDLDESADVAAFAKKVEAEANPGWNICTVAETVTVGACGNNVILAMCQKEIPARVSGKAEIKDPEGLKAGSEAEGVWNSFKTVMAEQTSPDLIAEEIANALVAAGVKGEAAGVMENIKNDYFLYEVESWNGASITDGDKLVYIFQLEMGADVGNWTSYYCEAKEGADLIFGSYNETIIAMINLNK